MCMGKVVVSCPMCKNQIQVNRPDSSHPFWSANKPGKDEGIANVVEQGLECKNLSCASKFSIYWYDK
jgi:hypothetical protein